MKVYTVYATIPKEVYEDKFSLLPKLKEELDFKFNSKLKSYIGLYAWTKKKSTIKIFKEFRNSKLYRIEKIKLDNEEFDEFKTIYKTRELNFCVFQNIHKLLHEDEILDSRCSTDIEDVWEDSKDFEFHMICPLFEFNHVVNDAQEVHMYRTMKLPYVNFNIFEPDYVKSLDVLGYSMEFYAAGSMMSNDDFSDECEMCLEALSYNASYNLTYLGNRFIDFSENHMATYLYIFSEMLMDSNERKD